MRNPLKKQVEEEVNEPDIIDIPVEGSQEVLDPRAELLTAIEKMPDDKIEEYLGHVMRLETDYTSTQVSREERTTSPALMELSKIFSRSEEGEVESLEDRWGTYLEVLGPKGNIPGSQMSYVRQANLGAILPNLQNQVYKYTYKYDGRGRPVRGEDGKLIVLRKEPIHLSVELKNLDLVSFLGFQANRAILQAKVLVGAEGGVPPGGVDPSWDSKTLDFLFGSKGKRVKRDRQ